MNSDVQDILSRFKNLQSPLARRTVYSQLLQQMSRHEWRGIRDQLNQVSFQKDILGSLPTEITVQIAKYLSLSELHSLRRVSKRWNALLSSDLICSNALYRYTGRSFGTLAKRSLDRFLQYAKQRTRLELGQPVFKVQEFSYMPVLRPNHTTCLDFSNGRFCTENRDSFTVLRVSEYLVAAITPRGYCYVWSLDSGDSSCFRLPSLGWKRVVVRGVNVAIAFSGTENDFIIHWRLDTHATRTFHIAKGLAYMDINPITDILAYPATRTQLRVIEQSLNGTVGTQCSSTYIMKLPPIVNPTWHLKIDEISSKAVGNTMGILSILSSGCSTETSCGIVAVTYNPRTNLVSLNTVKTESMPFLPLCMTCVDGILYYIKIDNGKPKIWVSDPGTMVAHRPAKEMNTQLPREASDRVYSFGTDFILRGDRDLILMVDQSGSKVWCFNEKVTLPGAA
ncbi:F-box domain protein [Aspergillus avenaceus]|uniref:F-box domain protein n=1 Tax=Aspergillus avenaceus TaxID=36643 RepID=A0A5N6TEG5_ASPAV|nr:F-box domain protein [Aspergillus avenaceus]